MRERDKPKKITWHRNGYGKFKRYQRGREWYALQITPNDTILAFGSGRTPEAAVRSLMRDAANKLGPEPAGHSRRRLESGADPSKEREFWAKGGADCQKVD